MKIKTTRVKHENKNKNNIENLFINQTLTANKLMAKSVTNFTQLK